MKKTEAKRNPKIILPIAAAVSILIIVSIVSFFTATNWIFLTTKEVVQLPGTTIPGSSMTTQPAGIKCKFTNYSIRPIYYGARFSVEKWVEDRWEEVPAAENLRFTLGISVVMPFTSEDEFYPTSLFTETSGSGGYRIVQDVWVGDSKNAKEHALYCKFTVN